MKEILDIFFLIFSNINVLFTERKLIKRFYIPAEVLMIIKKVQIIN